MTDITQECQELDCSRNNKGYGVRHKGSYDTHADNMRDMHTKGRAGDCRNFGTSNGNAKLTENDVPVIRQRLAQGESRLTIAADYGVSKDTIWQIKKGYIWRRAP